MVSNINYDNIGISMCFKFDDGSSIAFKTYRKTNIRNELYMYMKEKEDMEKVNGKHIKKKM